MGLPKITFPVLTLMFLVVIGGPAAILIFSREMPWLAIPLCVVLLLLGRYAATPGLRRLFTAVLLVTAIGTAISSILLAAARQDALAEPRQIWHVLVVIGILASSYCIGYFVVWYAFRLLSSFSIDFLCGLDEYIQKDTPEVRGFLINQYLGIGQAYQIVEDGKVVTTKPAGVLTALGGKGLLLIKPANAVVTEWGGDIRRVLGPGITWTERFERVKQVVPLNPQRVEFDVSAQTCEGIQLQVKGFFYCGSLGFCGKGPHIGRLRLRKPAITFQVKIQTLEERGDATDAVTASLEG
ncbi:MAG: hypothetical protein NT169_23645, partial [Chloroflexi bacterium]|nr:hypothetical protein [Chloroflexota bacterium]